VAAWFDDYNTLPAADNPSSPGTVEREVSYAQSYADSTGHAVYNGEWGAHDCSNLLVNACSRTDDIDSRVAWMRNVRQECESLGIGWAVWEDQKGLKLFDTETGEWNQALLAAFFE
jgi:hypothetical protein